MGGQESSYISLQASDYELRISGVDRPMTTNDAHDMNAHYIQHRYNKLTIVNNNDAGRDLIFDLYECTAAQDIADSNFANPAQAMLECYNYAIRYTSGIPVEPFEKGIEPTDFAYFGKYWTIDKKTKVRIPGGVVSANAVNSYNYQTFKMYSKKFPWYGQRANNKWAMKGITRYWLLILEPEQNGTRYASAEDVASVWFKRLTHFKQINVGAHTTITAPNSLRLANSTPSN